MSAQDSSAEIVGNCSLNKTMHERTRRQIRLGATFRISRSSMQRNHRRILSISDYLSTAVPAAGSKLRGDAVTDLRGILPFLTVLSRVRRPRLLVVDFGPLALLSCLYRQLTPHGSLYVYLSEPPTMPLGWLASQVLRKADGILVDGHATSVALSSMGYVAHRVNSDRPGQPFLAMTPKTLPAHVRRIIVVGDLAPASGAYDLLVNVAAWSASHADETVELHWIGEGDLAALLAAQPLQPNLLQVFHGKLSPAAVAAMFAEGGIVAVPSISDQHSGHVAEALAAGLPVLGSRGSSEVRRHVTDGLTGWLFDPLAPGALLDAITRVFATDDERLAEMSTRARAAITSLASAGLARTVRQERRSPVALHSTVQTSL